MFQSLRFCDSYLLGWDAAAAGGGDDDGPGMVSRVVEVVGTTSTPSGSGGDAPAPDAESMMDQ